MNIVLLEPLGVSQETMDRYAEEIKQAGHTFAAYERTEDTALLVQEARDADALILANMPLKGEVIRACTHLKYIDVASQAWIMWIWKRPGKWGLLSAMRRDIPMILWQS